MNLRVERIKNNGDTTIGKLYINDEFECWTLEDEYRTKKVWGETRIPSGTYKIAFRKEGSFDERYSKRFPDMHTGMLHVLNVPNFNFILIHIGNDDDDTAGCLLVGSHVWNDWNIGGSTDAYKKMYPKVAKALEQGKDVYITYVDKDLAA